MQKLHRPRTKVLLSVLVLIAVTLSGWLAFALTPVPNTAITPTPSKPYVLETPFADFDYFIGQYSNSSYYAINASNWDNFIVSTNASYVINLCTQATTYGSICLRGNIELTAPIWIYGNGTCLNIENLTATVSMPTGIIRFADPSANYVDITVQGLNGRVGYVQGNDNTLQCTGINFTSSGVQNPIANWMLNDLVVKNMNGTGIAIGMEWDVSTSCVYADNVQVWGLTSMTPTAYAWWVFGSDMAFTRCGTSNDFCGSFFLTPSTWYDNFYFGGMSALASGYAQFLLQSSGKSQLSNILIDYCVEGGFLIDRCDNITINGLRITQSESSGKTALEVYNSTGVHVNGFFIDREQGGYNWNTGILESGSSARNTYSFGTMSGCTTYNTTDTTSKIIATYQGSTYVSDG